MALYARRHRDRTLLVSSADNAAGSTSSSAQGVDDSSEFPIFRRVPGHTLGASITADIALKNETLLQGSYTAQMVRDRVDGRTRPSDWDVPHNLSVVAGVPLGARWTLTAAGQFRSGLPLTPVASRIFRPDGDGRYAPRFIYGDPNSVRLPAYRRVDLGVRHGWRARGADWTLSVQALNVFARVNALDRNWGSYFGCVARGACSESGTSRHGLPILPSAGLEVRW